MIDRSALHATSGNRIPGAARLVATAAAAAVLAVGASDAGAAVFTDWGTPDQGTGPGAGVQTVSGTLGGTSLTMNVANASLGTNFGVSNRDLTNASIWSQPGSASEEVVIFQQDNSSNDQATTTTITFVTAVSDLGLYMRFFRGGDYTMTALDASSNAVSYSFYSGNYPSTPTVTGNQFTLTGNFTSGIIAFNGAVKTLSFSYVNGTGLPGNSDMTLGILASPVPGGGAAILAGAFAAPLRRRRR